MTCSKANCEKQVHENINEIKFDKCVNHYLESMSTLRE